MRTGGGPYPGQAPSDLERVADALKASTDLELRFAIDCDTVPSETPADGTPIVILLIPLFVLTNINILLKIFTFVFQFWNFVRQTKYRHRWLNGHLKITQLTWRQQTRSFLVGLIFSSTLSIIVHQKVKLPVCGLTVAPIQNFK